MGQSQKKVTEVLQHDEALAIDCNDIAITLFGAPPPLDFNLFYLPLSPKIE